MTRKRFELLVAAALATASLSTTAMAEPEPALWKIEKDGSTVYLFGSVHALPDGIAWRTPVIDKAIKSADALVFEMPMSERSGDHMRRYFRDNGVLPRGKTISKMLSPEGLTDYKALLARSPVEPEIVNVSKPWFALFQLETSGFVAKPGEEEEGERVSPVYGVDLPLQQEADKNKTTKRYLETPEDQIAAFAAASPDDDIKTFERRLHDMNTSKPEIKSLIANWSRGNVPAIAKYNAEMTTKWPAEREYILDKRNQAWIPKIDKMLTEKKTIFITVGAAHLAGKGSVIDLLCAEGHKVQRIKTGATAPPPTCDKVVKQENIASIVELRR